MIPRDCLAFAAALAVVAPNLAAAVEPAPAPAGIARFTRHARFVEAKISPKGTYLAAITQEAGRRTLAFIDLKSRRIASQLKPDSENMPGTFYWANDERVVVALWRLDAELDAPTSAGELYAVDATGKGGRLAMVVLPHGGPHFVRDRWSFDPEVQLLASAGYAVLRVNYRGSHGYGDAYEEAGYGRWGDRVVQDVVDATRWAVRKGFADPDRICAYGASFGAYASLQAAILAPDLFRCAVGFAGVYDLTRMSWTGDIPWTHHGRGYVRRAIGTDEAALKAASPVYNANKLRARVLLVHGEEDQRAPLAHAERMRKALVEAGRPPGWLVEPREGHGFYDETARERMWTRVLAFLAESTAPASPPAAPAEAPAKAPAAR
ncbi:MAG TPA: alpha/beta fold hydrolase [Anaeromyxobacter sp.]|nr:alpha/beta fold hydrolase [Anaeromyxobacter sp.]